MSLAGTYHQINHFFKNVGDLRRIVNIEDLKLEPSQENTGSLSHPTMLKASFVATTFQFQDKGNRTGQPKGPSTVITSGGGR
jgi:Tfp pilus assembly protein PilO